jgi:hypothetical protein
LRQLIIPARAAATDTSPPPCVTHFKTRIQRTTSLSSTEAEIIGGCDAGKDIKYFRKLFDDLGFPITKPTLVAEDNAGTILIANHRRPSGRTRLLDLQYFATQEWVQRGLMFFYNGSTHATHPAFLPNPDDNSDCV